MRFFNKFIASAINFVLSNQHKLTVMIAFIIVYIFTHSSVTMVTIVVHATQTSASLEPPMVSSSQQLFRRASDHFVSSATVSSDQRPFRQASDRLVGPVIVSSGQQSSRMVTIIS